MNEDINKNLEINDEDLDAVSGGVNVAAIAEENAGAPAPNGIDTVSVWNDIDSAKALF